MFGQCLGQKRLLFVVIKVGNMHQRPHLILHRTHHLWVAVANIEYGDTRDKIQVFVPVRIPHAGARTLHQRKFWRIGWDQILFL